MTRSTSGPGLILALGLILACAPVSSQTAPATASPSPRVTLTGWVVLGCELRLYERKEDVGKLYDRSCVSGKFDRMAGFDRAARRYGGKHVRITGFLIATDVYWSRNPFGATIENYCDGHHILIAETIAGEPEPPGTPRRARPRTGR